MELHQKSMMANYHHLLTIFFCLSHQSWGHLAFFFHLASTLHAWFHFALVAFALISALYTRSHHARSHCVSSYCCSTSLVTSLLFSLLLLLLLFYKLVVITLTLVAFILAIILQTQSHHSHVCQHCYIVVIVILQTWSTRMWFARTLGCCITMELCLHN
jgi:hypothetical protein